MPGPRLLAALCGALLCASGLLAFSGDFCDSSQCLNGGTCLLGRDNTPFYCLCPEGFTGIICNETEKGPCNPNPCYNDAECQVIKDEHRGDIFTQYVCKCPHGYTGVHCEIRGVEGGGKGGGNPRGHGSTVPCHLTCLPPKAILGEPGVGLDQVGLLIRVLSSPPWVQVNLVRKMWVTGVVTQGASRASNAEYLKTFKVAYSLNGRKFQFIQSAEGSGDKLFVGNTDNSGLKVNLFDFPLEVQYVRLVPITCHRGCTLRFELLGCELNGCAEPLGMKDNTIPDRQITASSIYRTWGLNAFSWYPFYARLDKQGKFNAWTAQTNDASEWLQVDLGTKRQVTGIITQGARDFGHIQYVAAYRVAYSNNSMNWTEYRDQGALDSKIFPGNLDNNSHKKNMFEMPFLARFVRVLPVAWHNRITLRVELLGC
ncbi:milk fat globule-egf factor 8 [Lynx pardinus]|uniref:Milk fat globule-egf factor 8 n=1 Tax=Lynx pardinus TaxID=191816 RepID=A0A485MZV8_LYNPA|nr:milk fat globule-egf factor 8 [Lynx pardinus]